MLILTVKVPPRKTRLAAGAIALALAVGVLALAALGGRASSAMAPEDDALTHCLDCLEGFGWEVAETPVSTETGILSTELSQDYLDLQRQAGFDLTDDLGANITRYTFEILNYPTGEAGVLADLLVRDGTVIGGDVRTSGLDGFLHSLNRPAEESGSENSGAVLSRTAPLDVAFSRCKGGRFYSIEIR